MTDAGWYTLQYPLNCPKCGCSAFHVEPFRWRCHDCGWGYTPTAPEPDEPFILKRRSPEDREVRHFVTIFKLMAKHARLRSAVEQVRDKYSAAGMLFTDEAIKQINIDLTRILDEPEPEQEADHD